ncbi:MAG: cohesin domain-containing protein [Ardenticatenales bacterium]
MSICAWLSAPAHAQPPATIAVGDATIGEGRTGAVVVTVRDVVGLYGADVQLAFDPHRVQVEDANPAKPGVQVQLGSFLSADLVVRNVADNVAGTVHVAATQLNPAAPASGTGELFSVTFRALNSGVTTPVTVASSMLSSRDGIEIPAGASAGRITLVARADAPATPTAEPVREPTLVLPPSSQPTARTAGTSARTTPPTAAARRSAPPQAVVSRESPVPPPSGARVDAPPGDARPGDAAGSPATGNAPALATGAIVDGRYGDATPATTLSDWTSGGPTGVALGGEAPASDGAGAEAGEDATALGGGQNTSSNAPDPATTPGAAVGGDAPSPPGRPGWPWLVALAVLVAAALVAVVRRS